MNYRIVLITILLYKLCTIEAKKCTKYNSKLSIMKINCTNIKTLKYHHIKRYPETKILLASFANITNLGRRVFRNFRHINTISLSNNEIRVIRNYVFNDCISLKILYLYNNKIIKIASRGLETIRIQDQYRLRGISLANNDIRVLRLSIFWKCCFKTLTFLDLSNNPNLNTSVNKIRSKFSVLNWENILISK